MTSTLRAFLPSGGLNALTAFETASMPVRDEPPLANARASTKIIANVISALWFSGMPAPQTAACAGMCTRGSEPKISRPRPTAIMMMTTLENRYVGTANTLPASRMPRRLPYSISSTTKIEISVMIVVLLIGLLGGKAEATAAVPAAT